MMNQQNSDSCKCKKCLERTCYKNNGHVDLCDCEDYHRINTAGMKNNVNRKLNRCRNCEFDVTTVGCSKKRGKVNQLGIDYVDIKERKGDIVTVLRDKVHYFNWSDKACKCNQWRDRHCDCHKHRDDNWCKHHNRDCHKHRDNDCRKHHDCDCHKHRDNDWCKRHDCECRKHHDNDCRKHHDCECRKHHHVNWN